MARAPTTRDARPTPPEFRAWPALAALLLFAPGAGAADPTPAEDPGKYAHLNREERDRRILTARAVVALVGVRGGHMGGLIVQEGSWLGSWPDVTPAARKVPVRIDPDLLAGIVQNAPVGKTSLRKNAKDAPEDDKAYAHLLVHARDVDADDLRDAAAAEKLNWVHLMEQPFDYRGAPVHVEGTLLHLFRYDAPQAVHNDGIHSIYEGWIFQPYKREPFVVVFTQIPEGVELGKNLNCPISCDAFFFKRYGYEAGTTGAKPNFQFVPLLLGSTFRVPRSPNVTEGWGATFLPAVLGCLASLAVLAIGLGWWFRRGDRAVQRRLSLARPIPVDFHDAAPVPEVPARGADGTAGTGRGSAE